MGKNACTKDSTHQRMGKNTCTKDSWTRSLPTLLEDWVDIVWSTFSRYSVQLEPRPLNCSGAPIKEYLHEPHPLICSVGVVQSWRSCRSVSDGVRLGTLLGTAIYYSLFTGAQKMRPNLLGTGWISSRTFPNAHEHTCSRLAVGQC